jgi:hypothetical protein
MENDLTYFSLGQNKKATCDSTKDTIIKCINVLLTFIHCRD